MSILIRGMEMPKKGSWISLRVFPDGQCFLYSWCGNDFDFMEHLTAAPVPPHGRLGDLDALKKKALIRSERRGRFVNVTDMVISAYDIETATTIIPAEEE